MLAAVERELFSLASIIEAGHGETSDTSTTEASVDTIEVREPLPFSYSPASAVVTAHPSPHPSLNHARA
jgi:hypothetical protein